MDTLDSDVFLSPLVKSLQQKKANTERGARRVFLVVLDGVGAGESEDSAQFKDQGASTLAHVAEAMLCCDPTFRLPILESLGLGRLTPMGSVCRSDAPVLPGSIYGKCSEVSLGKDTTTGHWEMIGIQLEKPFKTYPHGFPASLLDAWARESGCPGYLVNQPFSGTEVIDQYGEEHLKTGKPIVYTSIDSVWQIAAHEEAFGLDRLYEISKIARRYADDLGIARVIARPFIGTKRENFSRTYSRKDFSCKPTNENCLTFLQNESIPVLGVGKIFNIFNGVGIHQNFDTHGNSHGMDVLQKLLPQVHHGLVFINLIDFDMLYGHRRDASGFGKALKDFDHRLGSVLAQLGDDDLLIITGDHGNDPTFAGTDHTREYVPFLVYSKHPQIETCFSGNAAELGVRSSFSDVGMTATHWLSGTKPKSLQIKGESIFSGKGTWV